MLIPVVCITCAMPIGDRAAMFRRMRADRVKKELDRRGTHAARAADDVGLQLECSDILEKLGVKNDCCRMHLATAMVFSDYNR